VILIPGYLITLGAFNHQMGPPVIPLNSAIEQIPIDCGNQVDRAPFWVSTRVLDLNSQVAGHSLDVSHQLFGALENLVVNTLQDVLFYPTPSLPETGSICIVDTPKSIRLRIKVIALELKVFSYLLNIMLYQAAFFLILYANRPERGSRPDTTKLDPTIARVELDRSRPILRE
jgi:hypothetical protein